MRKVVPVITFVAGVVFTVVTVPLLGSPGWNEPLANFICSLEGRDAVFRTGNTDETICVDFSDAYSAGDVLSRWEARLQANLEAASNG